ncbi:MAG TPA: amidohydrolase family protein [Nitrososphaerales archaeon]|nr:amidohydrolase family protein [Nitrososphaerales archaeon]
MALARGAKDLGSTTSTINAAPNTKSRLRHVRGGLDNAVRQAEQRKLHDLTVIDIDVHQNEPFTLFARYLPDKFKREYTDEKLKAMGAKYDDEIHVANYPVGIALRKQMDPLGTSRFPYDLTLGGRIRRPEVKSYGLPKPRREASVEETVDMFTQRLQDIGIKRCIVFPNVLLSLSHVPDKELQIAVANAYMDFMLDNFLGKYPEILSCVCVPTEVPDKAAELIDRVGSEKGIVGVAASPSSPGALAGEEAWNPIYEAAEHQRLPIAFHGELYNIPPLDRFKPPRSLPVRVLGFPLFLILQLTSIVAEGVPERYKKTKFVFIEGGVTWIPWLMYRMDTVYRMRKSEAPMLTKPPSEYIKEFYYSTQPMEQPQNIRDLEWIFRSFNAGSQLLYSSDYPHWDFDVPKVVYDMPFLTKEEKKNILGENARKVFKIN